MESTAGSLPLARFNKLPLDATALLGNTMEPSILEGTLMCQCDPRYCGLSLSLKPSHKREFRDEGLIGVRVRKINEL